MPVWCSQWVTERSRQWPLQCEIKRNDDGGKFTEHIEYARVVLLYKPRSPHCSSTYINGIYFRSTVRSKNYINQWIRVYRALCLDVHAFDEDCVVWATCTAKRIRASRDIISFRFRCWLEMEITGGHIAVDVVGLSVSVRVCPFDRQNNKHGGHAWCWMDAAAEDWLCLSADHHTLRAVFTVARHFSASAKAVTSGGVLGVSITPPPRNKCKK